MRLLKYLLYIIKLEQNNKNNLRLSQTPFTGTGTIHQKNNCCWSNTKTQYIHPTCTGTRTYSSTYIHT